MRVAMRSSSVAIGVAVGPELADERALERDRNAFAVAPRPARRRRAERERAVLEKAIPAQTISPVGDERRDDGAQDVVGFVASLDDASNASTGSLTPRGRLPRSAGSAARSSSGTATGRRELAVDRERASAAP